MQFFNPPALLLLCISKVCFSTGEKGPLSAVAVGPAAKPEPAPPSSLLTPEPTPPLPSCQHPSQGWIPPQGQTIGGLPTRIRFFKRCIVCDENCEELASNKRLSICFQKEVCRIPVKQPNCVCVEICVALIPND